MLYPITETFQKLGLPSIRNDDFFDRLSRRYSMILLGISFIIVTTTQFVGNPIHCFTKLVDMQHKVDYVNSVCWISSSYYLPFETPLPNRNETKPTKIPYYQWVPFILFSMLVLFYIPGFIWRAMNKNCGIDTKSITRVLHGMDPLNSEERKKSMSSLVKHIDEALKYHRDYHHGLIFTVRRKFSCLFCCTIGKHSGNYLSVGYIIVKVLYILNALGQLFLLNIFMGDRFHMFGIQMLRKFYNGEQLHANELFPRITMCDYSLRTLGDNIQTYSVQCLLPINIYNEKIFLAIWFWLAFVTVASICGLVRWLLKFNLKSNKNFIRSYLKANDIDYYSDGVTQLDPELLRTFTDSYCRQDGLLLLRIIAANMNKVIVGELICALWENWRLQRQTRLIIAPEQKNQQTPKTLRDFDGNQSAMASFRVPSSTVQDDRYMLSPLRL